MRVSCHANQACVFMGGRHKGGHDEREMRLDVTVGGVPCEVGGRGHGTHCNMDTAPDEKRASIPLFAAWAVHVLTASGAVLAFFAFLAAEEGRFRLALFFLGAALVVDGIDGPLARRAGVVWRVPGIDGATLDLVVDYLTYVFVPVILIYRAGVLPVPYGWVFIAAILISSLYTFARTDMKTTDNFFLGFPALWNVVAFYLLVLQPGAFAAASLIGLFVCLTFAPVHFVHPLRVRRYQPWLAGVTIVWGMSSLLLLAGMWSPVWTHILLALSLTGASVLVVVGVHRTLSGNPTL